MRGTLRNKLPPMTTLAAFEAAARLGSFSLAASELNITQSAISRQMRVLEDWFGCKVFHRNRHSITLTDEGDKFSSFVTPALLGLVNGADETRSLAHRSKEIVVFSDHSISSGWLVDGLTQFGSMFPEVDIRQITSGFPIDMEHGHVDVGIQYGQRAPETYNTTLLAEGQVFPVCSPDYFANRPHPKTIKELANERLLHFDDSNWPDVGWKEFISHFGEDIPPKNQRLTFSRYKSLLDAAQAGQGIMLGWQVYTSELLKNKNLIRVTEFNLPGTGIYVHVPRRYSPPPIVDAFVEWLHARVTEIKLGH